MNKHHDHDRGGGDVHHGHTGAGAALTLISLAHSINHGQSALKPLVYPLVLRELGFGYAELGIMLGVASAVGGLLQFVAGALGRFIKRHLLLGLGNASVGICFFLVALAQSFPQFFFWTVMSRVGGAAQHPVGSALLSHHFQRQQLGSALAAHFTAGNIGTALIPLFAALLISLWGWRVTTILFAIPAIVVGLAMSAFLQDPRETGETANRPKASFWQDSKFAIQSSNLRWILLAAVVAAGGSGHGVVSTFLPLYLSHNLGMETATVGVVFTVLMIGSIAGPLLGGRLADRFHPQKVLLGAYAVAALTTISFPWAGANMLSTSIAALILGASAFGTHPILQTMVVQVTDDRTRDMGFAWFYTATFMAGAIWSPAVGYVAELLGLTAVFGAMAASFVMASLCIVLGQLHALSRARLSPTDSWSHG
ncbi:MAG TPA: MFS transporter [Candidatus Binatia bacterium]|nr:MFS transporter [Candidatus Binatia bacterium]